jgi:hypothetical protein
MFWIAQKKEVASVGNERKQDLSEYLTLHGATANPILSLIEMHPGVRWMPEPRKARIYKLNAPFLDDGGTEVP